MTHIVPKGADAVTQTTRRESLKLVGAAVLSLAMPLHLFAERLNVSAHRLKYALERHKIAPVARVGILRVWCESDIPRIRRALAAIARNRTKKAPSQSDQGRAVRIRAV